jgi:membrane-bound ClpP family serine protease
LAHFIALNRDLSGVKTVAYIPKTIKGHAVLVAMACEEIIMAPDAEIGDAGIDETVIGPTIRSGYKEIADARKNIPPALALGMLDKDLKVLKVLTEQGTDIILSTDLDALKKQRAVIKSEELAPVPGLYSGNRGRTELGFVTFLADSRQDVAKDLGLAPDALRDDPRQGGPWRPVRIPIRGVITESLIKETQAKIRDQIENHEVNFICLWIDSAGGLPEESVKLAGYLADLPQEKVRTVAYIPEKARGDASLIAAACDQIVAGPDAILGGSGEANMPADQIAQIRRILQDIEKKKGNSWSIPVALVDPNLKIYRYTQRDRGQEEFVSPDEIALRNDAGSWKQGDLVWQGGSPWRLSGQRGENYGLVWHTVDNFNEFKQLYGLENDVALVEPGWADFLIGALSSPSLLGILMFLGLAGVVAELYSPGLGLGAFVAIVAFMLYFWILHLHGTAGWLEVLLFLAGVCCLLLEIFVLPGFAIFGLGGGLMIIASLVLASQTFILPRNDYQWEQMQTTLVSLGGAVIGAFVAAVAFRRFLPHAPVLNRVFLHPPSGEERQNLASRESLVDFAHLVGRSGITATPLMPSGKARFGDELLDVIADGEAIDRGQAVIVVDVRGNRVLVHRAPA